MHGARRSLRQSSRDPRAKFPHKVLPVSASGGRGGSTAHDAPYSLPIPGFGRTKKAPSHPPTPFSKTSLKHIPTRQGPRGSLRGAGTAAAQAGRQAPWLQQHKPVAQSGRAALLIGGSPAPPPVLARTARNSPGKAYACGVLRPASWKLLGWEPPARGPAHSVPAGSGLTPICCSRSCSPR